MKKKIKVGHIMGQGFIGGLERSLYLLIKEQLRDPELEIAVIMGQPRGPYYKKIKELDCRIIITGIRKTVDLSRTFTLARYFNQFDIHHFHNSALPYIIGSILSGQHCRIYTCRGGYYEFGILKKFKEKIVAILLKKFFTTFTANTYHAARVASEFYGIPLDKFITIYNGLDFQSMKPQRDRNSMRRDLKFFNDVVVGTSGKFKKGKRIDLLLDACSRIGKNNIKILLVGDGPDRHFLEKLARAKGLIDKVIFTGFRDDVFDYINAMDIFVFPSLLESFGNAAVEAMALGIPTIVFSDGGGVTEHIINHKTGFIVENEDQLKNCIEYLIANPHLRKQISWAGSKYVHHSYTLSMMARKYKGVYLELLNKCSCNSKKNVSSNMFQS